MVEDLNIMGIKNRQAIYRDRRECGKIGVESRSPQRTVGLEEKEEEEEEEKKKKTKKKKKKKCPKRLPTPLNVVEIVT